MPNIQLANMKQLKINGTQVKLLRVNGEQVKFNYNVSFNTSMSGYYYMYGQSGTATTVSSPETKVVPIGMSVGTLPEINYKTYIYSNITYNISVSGWFLDAGLTMEVTENWVPTSDTVLYAKWKMNGDVNVLYNSTTTETVTFTVPKFASAVRWSCTTEGSATSAREETASSGAIDVVICAPGAPSVTKSTSFITAAGKLCQIRKYSITVGGASDSVPVPSSLGSWHISKDWDDITSRNYNTGTWSISSGTFSSGAFSVNFSKSGSYIMANCYYNNSYMGSIRTLSIVVDEDDGDYSFYARGKGSVYYTYNSGEPTSQSGAYGAAWSYSSSVQKVTIPSFPSLTVYNRSCTVLA